MSRRAPPRPDPPAGAPRLRPAAFEAVRDGDFPGQMVPWFAAIRWSAGDSEELKEADYLYIVFNRSIVMRVALAAGRHAVTLGDGAPLPAGMYFVRPTQGRQNALSRVAVLR